MFAGLQDNPLLSEIRITDESLLRRREETLSHNELPWNVVLGCQPESEGCRACQAKARLDQHKANAGLFVDWSGRGATVELEQALSEPAAWTVPQRVVIAPLSDLFQPAVSRLFIERVLKTVAAHPQHVFLLTTRHPRRMREVLQAHPAPQNLSVGVSAEDAATLAGRLPYLFEIAARWRHLVLEPLLGPVDLECVELPSHDILLPLQGLLQRYAGVDSVQGPQWQAGEPVTGGPLDWVIVGGERGAAPRPPHPSWVRAIRDACAARRTPFYFRGWGDYVPTRKPDPRDARLLLVGETGLRRACGGSGTAPVEPAAGDVYFTRLVRGDEPIQFFLDGQRHLDRPQQRPPEWRLSAADAAVLDRELQRLTPRSQARRLA